MDDLARVMEHVRVTWPQAKTFHGTREFDQVVYTAAGVNQIAAIDSDLIAQLLDTVYREGYAPISIDGPKWTVISMTLVGRSISCLAIPLLPRYSKED